MSKTFKKLFSFILVFSICISSFMIVSADTFAKNNNKYSIDGVTAGVSLQLSLSLKNLIASVKLNDISRSTTAEEKLKDYSVEPELLALNDYDNVTVCGYVNLGIVQVDGNLNIREEASKNGKIIGKITNNCGCEVLEKSGDWVRIESGNAKGWISADYVVLGDDALELVNEVAKHVVIVTADCLRVREEPSTSSSILTTVAEGEMLEIVEVGDEWIKVLVDDEEGYVFAEFCDTSYELGKGSTIQELYFGKGVTDVRVQLVQYALQFVGNRYVWGGTSLTGGIDCSGFSMQILGKFGVSLPHYSGSQAQMGTKINASEAKPGDLFFYGSGGRVSHVAIYIGNGQIVHASNAREGIKISNAFYRTPICVRSFLPR